VYRDGESAKDAQFEENKYGSHQYITPSENVAQTLFLQPIMVPFS
jgi:hypothetical protein